MPIKVIINCGQTNEFATTDQPGLYVTETTSDYSALIYRSTYTGDSCGAEGKCCELFKPGIMTCGLVDECEHGY